jgi:hypothetical protein
MYGVLWAMDMGSFHLWLAHFLFSFRTRQILMQLPGNEILAELFEEWDGHWTKSPIEIEDLRNQTWGSVASDAKRRLHPVRFVQNLRAPRSH